MGFCKKYIPERTRDWRCITLIDLVGCPWRLAYFMAFQLKRGTGPDTMYHTYQAISKVIIWALHRVCGLFPPCCCCCWHTFLQMTVPLKPLLSALHCRAGANATCQGCQPESHQHMVWQSHGSGKIFEGQTKAGAAAAGQGKALDGRPADAADRSPIPVRR